MRLAPRWELSIDDEDGARAKVFPIHCSACRKKSGMNINRWHHPPPYEAFRKYFHNKGWEIGKDVESDLCPGCVELDRKARRAKHETARGVVHNGNGSHVVPSVPRAIGRPAPALQFGPTYPELKALQRNFMTGRSPRQEELNLLRAQVRMFEKQVATFKRKIVEIEQDRGAK
jgi:hypothetical protein